MCPSAVGIWISPAVSPFVSVWIVCAVTGCTARANPAANVVFIVVATNSRRVTSVIVFFFLPLVRRVL